MDSRSFDQLTKSLSKRLSRRGVFRGGVGLGVAAVATRAFGASAQDSAVSAGDRFTAVRTYTYTGSDTDAAAALQGLIPVMESQPSFIRFEIVDIGSSQYLAISTFLDEASAVAAAQQEDAWIQQNASSVLPNPPSIQSGEVVARSAIDAGCGCITGTQDPCGSDSLTCCQLTDSMGGPGVCLNTATTCPGGAPAPPPTQPTATPVPPCTGDGCDCATGTESPCDSGLVCCTGSADAPPGAPGTCRAESACGCTSEGCHCNGGVQNNCDSGLSCCQDNPMPGGPGTCETTCEAASPVAAG